MKAFSPFFNAASVAVGRRREHHWAQVYLAARRWSAAGFNGPHRNRDGGAAASGSPDRASWLHRGDAAVSTKNLCAMAPCRLAPLEPGAPPPNPDRVTSRVVGTVIHLEAFEILKDMYGNPVPFNQRGQQVMDRRLIVQDNQEPYITPAIVCRPSGPVWDLIRIQFRVFHTKDKIQVFSDADRAWWQIPLNPSMALPPNPVVHGTFDRSWKAIRWWSKPRISKPGSGSAFAAPLSVGS
jgi:hypothetical protein